jgi:hypothetical protein
MPCQPLGRSEEPKYYNRMMPTPEKTSEQKGNREMNARPNDARIICIDLKDVIGFRIRIFEII